MLCCKASFFTKLKFVIKYFMNSSDSNGNEKLFNSESNNLRDLYCSNNSLNLDEFSPENRTNNKSISSDETISNNELFQFDNSYLTELNTIRKQCNLEEIPDEDIQETKTVDSHPKKEIADEDIQEENINTSLTKSRYVSCFVKHSDFNLNSNDCDIKELTYTPPKKKFRVEENLSVVNFKSDHSSATYYSDNGYSNKCDSKLFSQTSRTIQNSCEKDFCESDHIFKYCIKINHKELRTEIIEDDGYIPLTNISSAKTETYRERGKTADSLMLFQNSSFIQSSTTNSACSSDFCRNLGRYYQGNDDETNRNGLEKSQHNSIVESTNISAITLNVPDANEINEKFHVIPKIIILDNESGNSNSSVFNEGLNIKNIDENLLENHLSINAQLSTGLDIPRAMDRKYIFPAITNITEFIQNLANDVGLEKVCEKWLVDEDCVKKSIHNSDQNSEVDFKMFTNLKASSPIPENRLIIDKNNQAEAVANSNFNQMQHWRRKQAVAMDFYDVDSSTNKCEDVEEETDSISEEEKICSCFRRCCFITRKKSFS